jgi:hypothetical protein
MLAEEVERQYLEKGSSEMEDCLSRTVDHRVSQDMDLEAMLNLEWEVPQVKTGKYQ